MASSMWLSLEVDGEVHVVPEADQGHVYATDCWCSPDPGEHAHVYVHRHRGDVEFTEDDYELKGCLTKRRFRSRADARRFVKAQRSRGSIPRALFAYSCRRCGGWHLTKRQEGSVRP